MSMTVEEYVLSMQFDNREFEKNVDKTTKSLGNLKNSLKMDGVSRGLGEVSNSMKDLEYASYKAGFQWSDVKGKIASSLEWRIARQAIDSVTHGLGNLIGMLTGMSHIKSGLTEYETQLNAIQTILANTESKGTTLDDVNSALDELNKYADKTIYNFTEMTKNIGTFTAAGVDLDTSVSAIQGIANLAAVSGSTSQQASTAMYQLSQALATGTVKLMDWNSVVNAGMGGEVFQNALKDTARVHGVAIDQIIKDQGSFRESLSEGWLTSDILTETLEKFTMSTEGLTEEQINLNKAMWESRGYTPQQIDAIFKLGNTATDAATKVKTFTQLMDTLKESVGSGWAQSWEIIIGDFEEAKSMWSGLSKFLGDIVNASSDARNSMFTGVFESGWSQLLSGGTIKNEKGFENWFNTVAKGSEKGADAFGELVKQYGSVEKAIPHAFKDGTLNMDLVAKTVNEYVQELEAAGEAGRLNLGYTAAQWEELKKFNNQLQNGGEKLKQYEKILSRVSGRDLLFGPAVMKKELNELGEEIEVIDKTQSGAFANIYHFVMSIVDPIKKAFNEIFKGADLEAYIEKVHGIIESFHNFTASLKISKETSENIGRTFKGLFAAIDIVFTILKPVWTLIGKILKSLGPILSVVLKITAGLGDFVVELRKAIKGSDTFMKVAEMIGDAFIWVAEGLNQLFDQIKDLDLSFIVEDLKRMGTAFKNIWNGIKYVFEQFYGYVYQAAEVKKGEKLTFQDVIEGLLLGLKLLLTGGLAAKIIGFIKSLRSVSDEFKDFLSKFKEDIFGELSDFEKQIIKIEAFKAMSIAIAVLVGALLLLTMIPKEKLYTAVATLAITMGMLLAVFKMINNTVNPIVSMGSEVEALNQAKRMFMAASSLIPLTVSVLILASALKKISNIEWDKMKYGLIGMTVCMATLMGALWLIKVIDMQQDPKAVNKTVRSLIKISIAILALAAVLKILSGIPWKELLIALGVMTAALGELVGTLAILSKIKFTKNAKGNITKMVGIVTVLLVVSGVLAILSTIPWKKMITAVGAMTVVLAVLTGTLALLSKIKFSKNAKGNTLKIIGIAAALLALSGVLAILSTIPWKKMAVALTAMGITLLGITGVLALLSKVKFTKTATAVSKMIVIAGSLLIIAGTLKILATMTWSDIWRSMTAMGLTLVAFTASLAVLQKVRFTKTATATSKMIVIAGSLLLVAGVLKILATMSWDEMWRGIVGMTLALTALVGALAIVGLIANMTKGGAGVAIASASLILLALAVKAIIPSIERLGQLPIKTIVQGLLTMVAGIAALGIVSALLSFCIPAMLGIAGAITLLGVATLAAGSGIYIFALGLDLLCKTIIQNGSSVVDVLINIVKSLANLLPFIATKLGEAIVAFSKVIIDGAPAIAQAIVTLLLSVLDLLTTVIPELAKGIFTIVIELLTILKEYIPALVDVVVGLILTLIDTLTTHVPGIVDSLMKFFVSILESFTEAMKQVDMKMLMDAILSVAAIALFLGLLAGLTPAVPLAMVGVLALGVLIAELSAVLWAIGKITSSGLVESISNAAPLLGAIGTAIGRFVGGIIGGIAAEASNALPVLGDNLSKFMINAQPFIDGLRQLDAGMLANAVLLTGIIAAITATSILSGITNFLTFGATDITKFADDLAAFGRGIASFNAATSSIKDVNHLKTVSEAGLLLGQMAKAIPASGGLWRLITGELKLDDLNTNLTNFGTSLVSFVNTVNNIGDVDNAVSIVNKLNTSLSDFANSGIDSFINTFTKSSSKVSDSVGDMLNSAIDTVDKKAKKFKDIASDIMKKFIEAIKSYKTKVKDTFKDIIKKASIDAINNKQNYTDFYNAGANLSEGFAAGVNAKSSSVKTNIISMAKSALQAAKDVLGINSPSKEFIDLGEYSGEGLIQGLLNYANSTYDAGSDLGDYAIDGLTNAVSKISSMVENDIDNQPVIRPVLDLSNIESGAGAINGMFGMSPSVGVMSRVNSISSSMNQSQNGGNSDVISAIDELKNTIKNTSGNTYNINGITYDSGSELQSAIETIVRATIRERRR